MAERPRNDNTFVVVVGCLVAVSVAVELIVRVLHG